MIDKEWPLVKLFQEIAPSFGAKFVIDNITGEGLFMDNGHQFMITKQMENRICYEALLQRVQTPGFNSLLFLDESSDVHYFRERLIRIEGVSDFLSELGVLQEMVLKGYIEC